MEYALNGIAALALIAIVVIDIARGERPFLWPGGQPRKPATLGQKVFFGVFAASLIASMFVEAPGA